MLRVLLATGNVVVSLVLGAIAFGFVFLKFPQTFGNLLDLAAGVKAWLTNRGLSDEYKNWVRVLLEERQLLFMGFTIAVRLALATLVAMGGYVLGRR